MLSEIIAKCLGIAMSSFLNIPYNDQTIEERYAPNGFENRASGICHYCTIATLKEILNNGCLRFSDVRFLNDSTEFVEIIPLVKNVLLYNGYSPDFKKLILESAEIRELEEYCQPYTELSRITNKYEESKYRMYICSFSTDNDSLNMWNYYGSSGEGVSIRFDHAWNIFRGSQRSLVNVFEKLENDIMIYRGLVVYKNEDKKKCIIELFNRLQQLHKETRDEIEKYQHYILLAFKQSVNNMRCFFKNESFECENEYRIVLKIPEKLLLSKEYSGDIIEKGQFKRGNILIPFVDYRFDKKSVESIMINPFVRDKNGMFKLGIKELLWQNKMENVQIFSSRIPIRKYN